MKKHDLLEEISDAALLADAVPGYAARFDAVKEIRNASDELWSSGSYSGDLGNVKIASIPEALLGRLLEIDPLFLTDKPKFKAWLERHPEFKTTNKRV